MLKTRKPRQAIIGTAMVAIIFILVGIYSCRKTAINPSYNVGKQNDLTGAFQATIEQAFSAGNYQTKNLTTKVSDSLQIIWKPNWAQLQEKVVTDTLNYLYIPLYATFFNPQKKTSFNSTSDNFKNYLIVKLNSKGMRFYQAKYLPENALPKAGQAIKEGILSNFSFSTFTGNMLLKDLDGDETVHQTTYYNGKVKSLTTSSNGKLKIDDIQDCNVDHFNCEWSMDYTPPCVQAGVVDDPGCHDSPGPYIDGNCTYTLSLVSQTPVYVCQTIYLPDLPPDPPLIDSSDVVQNPTPCAQKATVSQKAANVTIAGQNTQILHLGTVYEYGANQNLTSTTGSTYVNSPVTTDPTPHTDSWTPTFTWDSTNGYTIGASHDHPNGSAPSPEDVLALLNMFSNPDFKAAGSAALQFYQKNASITVITTSATYVITVNNWNDLQRFKTGYFVDQDASDKIYNNLADDYAKTTPASQFSPGDDSEFALKTMMGSIINIYKAPAGTTTFTPQVIGAPSNGISTIGNMPCP